jgi:hypothetical protein
MYDRSIRRPTVAFGCRGPGRAATSVTIPLPRQVRVVEPDLGVVDRRLRLDLVPCPVRGIARDEVADHLAHVVVRPPQPVLHGQEVGAQVLRLAGQEPQDLRQPPQHPHLPLARGRPRGLGLELLQDRHDPRGGLAHVEVAHLGEIDDLPVGDHPHHRVAMGAARLEVGQDRRDMLFKEQQVRHDDVGMAHRILRPRQSGRVLGPFGRGQDFDAQTREILGQRRGDARGGAGRMGIEREDHDPVAGDVAIIAHSGPLPRRGSRR